MLHAVQTRDNNFAFIDSQNVNLGVRGAGWRLDFARFRIYLKEKYDVAKAYLFIGRIPGREHLYERLASCGYILIFKPVVMHSDGIIKGNCDAELVLHAMIEYLNYDRAVIASGDGDFYCLADYLRGQDKLCAILIPNQHRFSALLRTKELDPFRRYLNKSKNKLRLKKEA